MSYQRFRARNGLLFRTEGPDPYDWGTLPENEKKVFNPSERPGSNMHTVCGDLNRMERDYLGLNDYAQEHYHGGRDGLLLEVAMETGVSLEDCRKVLKFVFLGQK